MSGSDWYEIRIEGLLSKSWTSWFAGLGVQHTQDGNTVLTGILPDQAALHGVLMRVCDLGLPLVHLQRRQGDALYLFTCCTTRKVAEMAYNPAVEVVW